MSGAASTSPRLAHTTSMPRLIVPRNRVLRKPSEKISQLGRRFSTAILPVYCSYTDARWSNVTPSSFISRSLSTGSGQAHDHAVDTEAAHDPRNVLDGADDARVEERRTDLRRIRVDETGDLDAELVAVLVELARQVHARRAGADEQQLLARADAAAQPLEQ